MERRIQFPLPAPLHPIRAAIFGVLLWIGGAGVLARPPQPAILDIPAQPAAEALLLFSKQSQIEVLFSYDALKRVKSSAVHGRFEAAEAIQRLLAGTGFAARRTFSGKFMVVPAARTGGVIEGRLLGADGGPAAGVRVTLAEGGQRAVTDESGRFRLSPVPPGIHRLVAVSEGWRPLEITGVRVTRNRVHRLGPRSFRPIGDATELEPYVVEARPERHSVFGRYDRPAAPPRAAGNLDLQRSPAGPLPYAIYDRERIIRSGVVDLNEFLQRELLESSAATPPPEQNGRENSFITGSTNLSLRGYAADETVILVNGRRLPEVLTTVGGSFPPDVNFIPLALVERVEVLPASASALYSGNAVGGVINIILREDAGANATELSTTYTNALRGFDAPQSTVSLTHARTLLEGALRLRLNASVTRLIPPSEAELGHHRRRVEQPPSDDEVLFRATPNVRSADLAPLFGPGSAAFTSVAPGASGTEARASFSGRSGVRSLGLFDSRGGMATSLNSIDYPYGREQERVTWFGSAVYDVSPLLQVGLDGILSRTIIHRGYDVLAADLRLAVDSPLNPFGQEVQVSLNETAPLLGEEYSEAQIGFSSVVAGAMLELPFGWRGVLDAQLARNVVKYRGLAGADAVRWQQLVDDGRYDPLRDTQVHGPPAAFYDEVLIYQGARDRFVTLGDYATLDAAVRVTHDALALPTGSGVVSVGGDYRWTQLNDHVEERRFGDGTPALPPVDWFGRSLERVSAFAEVQAPLLPAKRLPRWLRAAEVNAAVRYVAADTSNETNVAPTAAVKLAFLGGISFRGSLATSNRFPTPQMSRAVTPGAGGGGFDQVFIFDPRRNQSYDVLATDLVEFELQSEEALTQTAGLMLQRGERHRWRVAVDFFDTRKTNESILIDPQAALNLEELLPERVTRAPAAPGDPLPGRVTFVEVGRFNTAWRHSQNWTLTVDYSGDEWLGGELEAYARWLYFPRYERQVLPDSPVVDQLREPDGTTSGLLKHRVNFGASWFNRTWGFGLDGRYFHSRILPLLEWPAQGSDRIKPHWQMDLFGQVDVMRLLGRRTSRYGLRTQLRINNIVGDDFPSYANHPSGAGVQPYGDWRGRTYSLSLTATF